MKAKYKYSFVPVPSHHFGRLLGVDLIPVKTWSLNCIFCQLGRTKNSTITRSEYVPLESVLAELTEKLAIDRIVMISGSMISFLIVTLFIPIIYVSFIKVEEKMLASTFGKDWGTYKKRVRCCI